MCVGVHARLGAEAADAGQCQFRDRMTTIFIRFPCNFQMFRQSDGSSGHFTTILHVGFTLQLPNVERSDGSSEHTGPCMFSIACPKGQLRGCANTHSAHLYFRECTVLFNACTMPPNQSTRPRAIKCVRTVPAARRKMECYRVLPQPRKHNAHSQALVYRQQERESQTTRARTGDAACPAHR